MIKIYHNNRCRKSREGLEILNNSGKPFTIINYLVDVPSEEEIKKILRLLNITAINLVRTNEAIWKSDYKGKDLTETEIIAAMVQNPKLIERPIVINGNTAAIGRPPENIKKII